MIHNVYLDTHIFRHMSITHIYLNACSLHIYLDMPIFIDTYILLQCIYLDTPEDMKVAAMLSQVTDVGTKSFTLVKKKNLLKPSEY